MLRAAALPRVRRPALPRPPRALAIVLAVLLALGGAYLWVRDSSLVRVQQVTVSGLTGPEAPRLEELLTNAARDMTTLHVDERQLRAVVEPYPVVRGLEVRTDLPHGLRIAVREREAVAVVVDGGGRTAVAGDGTLLRGAERTGLPAVPLTAPQAGDRVTDARATQAIRTLAAAPPALLGRIDRVAFIRDAGLVLDLREGPDLRFGGGDRLAAKWAAAIAVLADASSSGAVYLDLRHPERPAAGGLEDPGQQLDPESANKATAPAPGTSTMPAAAQP